MSFPETSATSHWLDGFRGSEIVKRHSRVSVCGCVVEIIGRLHLD